MRFSPLVALFLLAACGGPSTETGQDPSSGEGDATQPTVQQAQPDDLMDDPRNEAVPVDPPLPTPTAPPGPLAPPVPAVKRSSADRAPGDAGAIPVAFHGRWTARGTRCGEPSDGGLTVEGDRLRFYESVARVETVEPLPNGGVRTRLAFSGEGERWTRDARLSAAGPDRLRIDQGRGADEYLRCPTGAATG